MPIAPCRSALVLTAALALPSCDRRDTPPAVEASTEAPPVPAPSSPAQEVESAERPVPEDPWQTLLASRQLAPSGLAAGSRLSAFEIIESESGDTYCQVCRYGSRPKIIAAGTADDEAFRADLQDLDAIVHKYGDAVAAFAVITELENGEARTARDPEAALARAHAIKRELRLSMPVVVPAPVEAGANDVWGAYYNVRSSRTVMFADGKNQVRFTAVGPEDWSGLDAAIREVLGPTG